MRRALGGLALVVLALAAALVLLRVEPPGAAPEAPAQKAPAAPTSPLAAPPATVPGPEPAAPDVDAPPSREELRAWLAAQIEQHLPDRKLSSEELDAAADALLRLRAARLELKSLPRTPESAERLRQLEEAMGSAALDFEYVLDLDPAEFTERIGPGAELDSFDPDEPIPEPSVLPEPGDRDAAP